MCRSHVTGAASFATIPRGEVSRRGSRVVAGGRITKSFACLHQHVLSVSGGNAVEKMSRALLAAVAAAALLTGCTGVAQTTSAPSESPSTAASGPASAEPSDSASPSGGATPSAKATATTRNQPVPKVQRSGQPKPSISAKTADTDGRVRYSDGVVLSIRNVRFGKETKEGPGRFPGRQFAVLDLQISNGSKRAMSLDTVVVTVLDKSGDSVPPVYVEEIKVSDFAGEVKAGATARATYAFAVPKSSRSRVTVVVDFDGVHTSAVFRGGLS